MKNTPKGKIIVRPIPHDLLDMLPEDTDSMTAEETHKFALAVFKRCIHYTGAKVDVAKLPKDFDEDELSYDPSTVIEGD